MASKKGRAAIPLYPFKRTSAVTIEAYNPRDTRNIDHRNRMGWGVGGEGGGSMTRADLPRTGLGSEFQEDRQINWISNERNQEENKNLKYSNAAQGRERNRKIMANGSDRIGCDLSQGLGGLNAPTP